MKGYILKKLANFNERSDVIIRYFEERMHITVIALFIISLIVRLSLLNYDSLLRKDAYFYMIKGLEVAQGNFIPMHTNSMGLPLFASPVFLLFSGMSVFEYMLLAKIISSIIGSAIIFPLYLVTRELTGKRVQLLTLLAFPFFPSLIVNSNTFLTEPLFTVFFLFSVYFIMKSAKRVSYSLLSFAFAAFSYYVRPTGIFILVVVTLSFVFIHFNKIKRNYRYLLAGIVLFWVISSPFLYLRFDTFGSPFTYGENDKYYVDSKHLVWSNNVEAPSLLDYLSTHNIFEIIDKFVTNGLFKVIHYIFYQVCSYEQLGAFQYSIFIFPFLIFFFLYGISRTAFNNRFLPVHISFLILIAGMSVFFSIFGTPRHIMPLVPLILMFVTIGYHDVLRRFRSFSTLIVTAACLLLMFVVAIAAFTGLGYKPYEEDKIPSWATWAADNIQGKIVIEKGGDLIMMNIPDTSVAGVGQWDIYAPVSGISITKPGYFQNLTSAMPYLKEIDATHIALDDINIYWRPYLKEVYLPEYSKWFTEIYSNYDSDEEWKMRIFRINWNEYEKSIDAS